MISWLHCTTNNLKFEFISYKLFFKILFNHLILICLVISLCLICKLIYSYNILYDVSDNIYINLFDTEILVWLFFLVVLHIYFMYSLKDIKKFVIISFCRWIILVILRMVLFFICPEDYHYLLTLSLLSAIFPDISEYIHVLLIKLFNLLEKIIPNPDMIYCYDGKYGELDAKPVAEWIAESTTKNYNEKDFPTQLKEIPIFKSTFESLAVLYHKPTIRQDSKVYCLIFINRKSFLCELNDVRFTTHRTRLNTPIDILVSNQKELHEPSNNDHFQLEINKQKKWFRRLETTFLMPNYKDVGKFEVKIGDKYFAYDPWNPYHNKKELWVVEPGFSKICIGLSRSNLAVDKHWVHPTDSRRLRKELRYAQGSTK